MTKDTRPDSERSREPREKSNRDLITALASGFVGALALAASLYNVYLQRQQVRAQVLPRLEWNAHWTTEDGAWTFVVSNRGVGPAEIVSAHIFVDGVQVPTWFDAAKALVPNLPPTIGVTHNLLTTISPGLEVTAFRVDEDVPLARSMFLERRRLRVDLCYCSTLEECWIVSGQGITGRTSTSVASCPPDAVPFAGFDEGALDEFLRQLSVSDAGRTDSAAARSDAGR